MVHLDRLEAGTRRIEKGDFSTRVEIGSGDEFEHLGEAFNSMANRLGQQFGTLNSMREISQNVLSVLEKEGIVRSVLVHFRELLPCETVSLAVIDDYSSRSATIYLEANERADGGVVAQPTWLSGAEIEAFLNHPKILMLDETADPPAYLPKVDDDVALVASFPIFVNQKLSGVISAGFVAGQSPEQEGLSLARQLADQVAVAFSNAQLLEELEQLSRGALTALARSIDAKSSWTAGHSERVAVMAAVIGEGLNLSSSELDILQRGSLLHDIGKIGVSSQVLDKPTRLTPEEMAIVREHPQLGVDILSPIAQLEDILPLVLHHHEWFDGNGYPAGLAKENIPYLARVLAVVDVYDAIRSPRPYRGALEHGVVLDIILQGNGQQFDPSVVQAFLDGEVWRVRPELDSMEERFRGATVGARA